MIVGDGRHILHPPSHLPGNGQLHVLTFAVWTLAVLPIIVRWSGEVRVRALVSVSALLLQEGSVIERIGPNNNNNNNNKLHGSSARFLDNRTMLLWE